jgi:hypothetical protein
MNGTHARVTYDLDERYRIVATGGEWDRFANENAALELVTPGVLGQPLWRFIQGGEVRHLLQLLLEHAQERGSIRNVPFRCDAPALRRFMSMNVYTLPDGGLRVESVLLRAEPRTFVPLLERSPRLLYGMLSICSWCKRVRLFNREWVEVEEAIEQLNLFSSVDLPQLSHGICMQCAQRTFRIIQFDEANGAV